MTKSSACLSFLCVVNNCIILLTKWISRSFPGDLEVWLLFVHVLFYTGNVYIDLKMFVIFILGVSHGDTSNSFSWLRLFSSSTYCKPVCSSPCYSWWYKNLIYGLYILARSGCGSLGIYAERATDVRLKWAHLLGFM